MPGNTQLVLMHLVFQVEFIFTNLKLVHLSKVVKWFYYVNQALAASSKHNESALHRIAQRPCAGRG